MVAYSKYNSAMSSSPIKSSMRLQERCKTFTSQMQFNMVLTTFQKLQESGFYWGSITGKEADVMLSSEPTGTFLIRDSSDNRHFFTLSVKTAAGTKNLRIQCDAGSFFLQTDPKSVHSVPHFDCVLKLVHYYMPQSKGGLSVGHTCSGNTYYIYSEGAMIPLELIKPFSSSLSTLQHLCRKTVNGHLDITTKIEHIPLPIKKYINDYDLPI